MQLVCYYTSLSFTALFLSTLNHMANYVCCSHQTAGVVSLTKSLVWGPGLNVDFVVPVRYFFIQPVDTEGHKYVSLVMIALQSDSAVNHQMWCRSVYVVFINHNQTADGARCQDTTCTAIEC